jgi:hypothetical protein
MLGQIPCGSEGIGSRAAFGIHGQIKHGKGRCESHCIQPFLKRIQVQDSPQEFKPFPILFEALKTETAAAAPD